MTPNTNNISSLTQTPVLSATKLGKKVGLQQLEILANLNLNIFAAQAVAIVGTSGAGKSTLLGLLAGLDTPTTGEVLLNNQSFSHLDEDARAAARGANMGFVFQSFQLIPTMTALQNVMLPLQIANRGDAEMLAKDALNSVGLAARMTHYPKQLSGGEQQRVAIARAFATNPKILFADEPTGNLDAATAVQIMDLIFDLNAQQHTTLVLVTHDMALAKRCQRTLLLNGGQLHDA